MYARILTKDGRDYFSTVFALIGTGWETAAITFDSQKQQFDYTAMYDVEPSLVRKVFIVDTDETNWQTYDKMQAKGLPWLMEHADLPTSIQKGLPIGEPFLQMAHAQNLAHSQNEWTFVETEADAENLLTAAWGFHDAFVEKVVFGGASAPTSVEVTFGGCWNCKMTLVFEGNVGMQYFAEEEFDPFFWEASVFLEDGFVYWTDRMTSKASEIGKDDVYFYGRALRWKFEPEKR